MPVPSSFDNSVILVTGSPVGADDLNAALTAKNADGYWATDLKFVDANTALFLFVKQDLAAVATSITGAQKVSLVAATQGDIDADKASETLDGNWPTGIFPTPVGSLLILYSNLTPSER